MLKSSLKSLVYYEHNKKDYVLMHKHSYYELVLYLSGNGSIGIEGESFKYAKNTLTIMKPGIVHDEKTIEDTSVYIARFKLDCDVEKDYYIVNLSEKTLSIILEILERIKFEESHNLIYKENYVDTLFNLILLNVFREINDVKIKENNLFIKKVKAFIKENYKQDIDFSLLSSTYGYSYDRFRHIFKEETGISLNQYLINYRLDKAKNLLQNSDLSIKEIAYDVGFQNAAYFSSYFLKRFSITPVKFRESTKNITVEGVCEI